MSYQIIVTPGGEEMVVIPRAEYERMRNLAEEREDAEDARAVLSMLAEGREDRVPDDMAERLLAGESPVKLWRQYRQMSQSDLAAAAGINKVYLSQIETGRRRGSVDTLAAIARALAVDLGDLHQPR